MHTPLALVAAVAELGRSRAIVSCIAATALAGVPASEARGQSIEPRSYSNAPVGTNFLLAGYAYTRGGLPSDTALPITDAKLTTSSAVLAYARALDVWGNAGKVDVIVPYTGLSGSALYRGLPVERDVDGFADPLVRLSVNFLGAPALTAQEFRAYRQDLIVGASLQVSMPAGQYDATRVVNIGTNRWYFKPEIGASKAFGSWIVEVKGAVTFFTTNDDFFNGNRRSQDPLYSFQGHAIYEFKRGIWASLDATYFTGGRTTINGTLNDDRQENWRVGGTFAFPLDARNSLKLYASTGVSARTGNSFDLAGIAWQYRWGAGL